MDPAFEKRFKAISPQCWKMYDSNKKLWNEIFKLGVQAERSRIKLRSTVRHWTDGVVNLPRFDGHGNSKKERGPDGSKKERATGLYGAIQKPSSGDGDPQRQEFGADCARAWV